MGGLPFGEYERFNYNMADLVPHTIPAQENQSFTQNDEDSLNLVENNHDQNRTDEDSEILDADDDNIISASQTDQSTSKPQNNFQTPIITSSTSRAITSSNPDINNSTTSSMDSKIKQKFDNFMLCVQFRPVSPSVWALQTSVYLTTVTIEKIIVYYILQQPGLQRFYDELRALLTQMIPVKEVEIGLVMFIIPFILNAFMFWVTDNILMKGMDCLRIVVDLMGRERQPMIDEESSRNVEEDDDQDIVRSGAH